MKARDADPMRATCRYCGGRPVIGSTCPRSIGCPACDAGPGGACRRPSGHRAYELHVERIAEAEAIDAASGIDYGPRDLTLLREVDAAVRTRQLALAREESPYVAPDSARAAA